MISFEIPLQLEYARGQCAMDDALFGQVSHALCNLTTELLQL